MNPRTLDGQQVRARVLGADSVPDGEWTLYPDDRPEAVTQIGALYVGHIESLGYTQYIVNGVPVDPATITPLDRTRLRVV